ncbi:MAG TPA: YdhR family protein [Terrimicrobiaceae bacterium]|nr:YdhR family protein [Terrimicrobiaceae bacterium]
MPHLLQINYRFSVSRAQFESGFDAIASEIAQVPGLRWKIWLPDEAESRGGGIYLFDDEESVRAYLEGPIVAALKSYPCCLNLV